MGRYIVIALGKLIGVAESFREAVEILRREVSEAKHAIIKKVGKEAVAEKGWSGLLERLK